MAFINKQDTNGTKGLLAKGELGLDDTGNDAGRVYVGDGVENVPLAKQVETRYLEEIAQTKAETAVDVFVYDTSKDSDGGAWRKRCQHTSWYNETLNTATRGSRKEFPAVAVIVAEADKVTIYDGDDPSLPMWMVFNLDSSFMVNLAGTTRQIQAVECLNGIMVVPLNNGANNGTTIIKFIEDFGYEIGTGYQRYGTQNAKIADRNVNATTFPQLSSVGIVSGDSNDVAMTVLPNAPIDPATGLPVCTIAVATDSGISVIKDDGTVVDMSTDMGVVYSVSLTENILVITGGGGVSYKTDIYNGIPVVDTNTESFTFMGSSVPARLGTNGSTGVSKDNIITKDALVFGLNNFGIHKLAYDVGNASNSMVNYITSKYNTGWQIGDTKLATLSDTDTTDLVGTELVTNGTFDTDVSGWALSDNNQGSIAVLSGALEITNNDQTDPPVNVYQAISTVVGKTYTASFDTVTGGTMTNGYVGIYIANQNYYYPFIASNASATSNSVAETIATTFTATSTTTYVNIRVNANLAGTVNVDNISVRLAEEDRSVNGNGLQVFGTITKEPVALGAELVSYSGFSASNYLEQPYNPDLDFGTGDFCVMGWVKVDGATAYGALIHRCPLGVDVGTGGSGIAVYSGGSTILGKVGTSTVIFMDSQDIDVWKFVALVRDGGSLLAYLDGVEVDSTTSPENLDDPLASLYVGGYLHTNNVQAGGGGFSYSLPRVSATAPTAEQIAKIYNDEKVLFQENAQATLYGDSDAVTALAYDEDEQILRVGTSSGRSDFSGLRRVSNTTTGVTTAISSSKGMVVEQ